LKLAVVNNNLEEVYNSHVDAHNKSMETDLFPNSGFDLFFPESTIFSDNNAKMVSMDIKAEMITCDAFSGATLSTAYYVYPRSSLSKTPLMLANHTGIIDSGYRGKLIGAFRTLSQTPYVVDEHTRLLQICHPQLIPIHVILVNEDDLSTTIRGEGGFGSTGK
jgi:dUTP pyrophosphatase